MKTQLKPDTEVILMGLPDPIMIIVSIDYEKGNAVCKYYDDYLQKHVKVNVAPDSLQPAPKKQKPAGEKTS
jgi:uncharacterized protein YodC (DUF2158 family)